METRHFMKTLCKQKVKTFFLSTLIELNVKWVPRPGYHALMSYLNISRFKDTHREKSSYEYEYSGGWYTKSTLFVRDSYIEAKFSKK